MMSIDCHKFYFIYYLIILLINFAIQCNCSIGDRLMYYRNCLSGCVRSNCSDTYQFASRQPLHLKLLAWNCPDECKYQCQWNTIDNLLDSGVNYNEIPQFYGKWTFVRVLGIQEPASVVFSILNLMSNYYGWTLYRNTAKNDPFYKIWMINSALSINAWIWSTVFHTRDLPITEKLDYFSAYSMVLFSLCAVSIRICDDHLIEKNKILIQFAMMMPFAAFYLYHIHYLYYIHFDYGYNMKVNIITGLLSSFFWLFWSYQNKHKSKHIWKCVVCIVLINTFILLELTDFPPLLYTFDAHSLWHLSTIIIPLIWYRFLIDEALYNPHLQLHCDSKKNN